MGNECNETNLLYLARKYNTDKCSNGASAYGYIPYYKKHFDSIRYEKLKILEIGVRAVRGHGPSSLKMWKDYFPNSEIYGLDIDPRNAGYDEERIKIFIGDQGDEQVLKNIIDEVGKFDIIIDDASHINSLTIKSWECLFHEGLKHGGFYVIEDLANSYLNLESFDLREKWEGMKYIPEDVSFNNDRIDMAIFFEKRFQKMDMCCTRWFREIETPEVSSMTFYPMICFMTKVYEHYDNKTQGFKKIKSI
jgi:hypothetical protein